MRVEAGGDADQTAVPELPDAAGRAKAEEASHIMTEEEIAADIQERPKC